MAAKDKDGFTCRKCRFFDVYMDSPKSDRGYGECRRRAPRAASKATEDENVRIMVTGSWPIVWCEDWCGEGEQ